MKWNSVRWGKNIFFVLSRLEQAEQDKNLLYRHVEPTNQVKDPFHMFSLSPQLPQFQQLAAAASL